MILDILKSRFRSALELFCAKTETESYLDLIRPAQDPKFGDYQANFAMPLAKKLGQAPRNVAADILEKTNLQDVCPNIDIAGPGFINLKIADTLVAECLQKVLADPQRLGIAAVGETRKKRFLVDFSSPNVAKPMHVGHIRSTIIGNALVRILRFLGHETISDNHIGDWGTQFGMIIYGYKNSLDAEAFRIDPLGELGRLYRLVRQEMDREKKEKGEHGGETPIGDAVLAETSKLHGGDAENLALWRTFIPVCQKELDRMYARLGIVFDHTLGESFYQPMLESLVESLLEKGLARETEGAIGIFLEGHDVPMLIRKKDGAFLYSTTDIATIRYRMEEFHPDTILYVVDFRQSHHFEQLFAACRLIDAQPPELLHIKFGTILGEDGKAFKTRSGDTVALEALLDEAEKRAWDVLAKNDDAREESRESPKESQGETATAFTEEQRRETARRIGLGALMYADLSQNRESDYVFSFDKMLAMSGNTATYMQYAYARVRSIFTKGGIDSEALRNTPEAILLETPPERALALELLKFDEAIESAARDYRPNHLTNYLFELANRYSHFFEHCPVLRAGSESVKCSRLKLCHLTAETIRKGLELLGIETVERM